MKDSVRSNYYELYAIDLIDGTEEILKEVKYLDEVSSLRNKIAKRIEKTRPNKRIYFREKKLNV